MPYLLFKQELPLLPIERLFASMDRVDHQKLLSTPSSTMPYADAVQRFKNPIESRITCPLFATYAWKWYEWPYFRFIYTILESETPKSKTSSRNIVIGKYHFSGFCGHQLWYLLAHPTAPRTMNSRFRL